MKTPNYSIAVYYSLDIKLSFSAELQLKENGNNNDMSARLEIGQFLPVSFEFRRQAWRSRNAFHQMCIVLNRIERKSRKN